MKITKRVRILSNNQIAPEAFVLKFSRTFDFVPGQVIAIAMNENAEPRLYSIASGNNHPEIWILYSVKKDGMLTPELARLNPGDQVYISDPFGQFECNQKEAVWIATGTGIAPFASMLYSGLADSKTLIQGNRFFSGIYFYNEIHSRLGERYTICCSREKVTGAFSGRITQYIGQHYNLDPNLPYYLCGSAEMVVDVRDILIEKGVPFNHIQAEIFF